MKSILAKISLSMVVLFSFIPAFAQVASPAPIAAPVDANSAVQLFSVLANFAHNGQYLLAGAAITLIICFILNQYILPKLNLGGAIVPLVSPIIGIISGVGLALVNGASPMAAALAVLSGPAAGHIWEMIGQYFVAKPADPSAPKS